MADSPVPLTEDYEKDRQRHVRAFARRLDSAVDQLTWPDAARLALRDERLRALLRTAKERSPWHANRLRHIDPEQITGDDLTEIPTMTKADLMENWDSIVTDPRLTLDLATAHLRRIEESGPAYLLDHYHLVETSGTSGTRAVFAWDFPGWLEVRLADIRSFAWLTRHRGWAKENRWAYLMTSLPTRMSRAGRVTFEPPETYIELPVSLPLAETVERLNAFRPTFLLAYPSLLHQLAQAADAGDLHIAPDALGVAGEPLRPAVAAAIEASFDAPLIDYYASSESGTMAHTHPGVEGLYLVEENAVLEPVDAAYRPVPAGVRSDRVLLTNVINQLLPLIRYELDDEITLLDEPDPGPWTGRRMAGPDAGRGRLGHASFGYPGGVEIPVYTFRMALVDHEQEIAEYQVRQTPDGADIDVRAANATAPDTPDLEALRRTVTELLRRPGLDEPRVTVRRVDHFPLSEHGKFKRFVPLAAGTAGTDEAATEAAGRDEAAQDAAGTGETAADAAGTGETAADAAGTGEAAPC
ncbi:phenylacetate--CoA ligase family protein [Streptomyces sp. cmx-18-6]|uniref:phenylacetate--CoA ligase family protein n=1 Tax=Streptomyces sp. cmx-18-6 TaxID=2790930 RepID=UPI00397F3A70